MLTQVTLIALLLSSQAIPARSIVTEENDLTSELEKEFEEKKPTDYYWYDNRKVQLLRVVSKCAALLRDGNSSTSDMCSEDYTTSAIPVESLSNVDWVGPVFVNEETGLEQIVTNEIIVMLKLGVDPDMFFGTTSYSSYRQLSGTTDEFVATLKEKQGLDPLAFANALHESNDQVVWATPDFLSETKTLMLPKDPLFEKQWQHMNTGQDDGTPGADAHMVRAWDVEKAHRDIVIAVIDHDGIQHSHEDLDMFRNPGEILADGVDNDNNGYVDDYSGWNFETDGNDSDAMNNLHKGSKHGTVCAGMAAAVSNAKGGVGSAFGARIMPIIQGFHNSAFAESIRYSAGATKNGRGYWRGADVISISLLRNPDSSMSTALQWAVTQGRGGLGVPIFIAAGNSRTVGVHPLAAHPAAIAVGSSNRTDGRAAHSSYGPGLDILAPGESVVTTDIVGTLGYNPGSGVYTQAFGKYGVLSLEAETGLEEYRNRPNWEAIQCDECSSGFAVEIVPDVGKIVNGIVDTTRLTWTVNFTRGGTHFLWVRGYAKNGWSNSCHVGFDGTLPASSQRINFRTYREWVWSGETMDAHRAALFIPTAGKHTVDVWMREDGFRIDKLVLTANPNFVPSDNGPPMSHASQSTDIADMNYVRNTGTSLAAPMAAGIGALLITARPEITAAEVKQNMVQTADKVGGVTYNEDDWHEEYGYGRVNAHKALTWLTLPALTPIDIGFVSHIGFYWAPTDPDGSHHIESAGSGIGDKEDGFHFAYMQAGGDYDMIARVNSIEGYGSGFKGGLMFRKNLNPDSKYVGLFVHNTIEQFEDYVLHTVEHRRKAGENANASEHWIQPDYNELHPNTRFYWVKLEKRGNYFRAFEASDGFTWTSIGDPMHVEFGTTFYVGLAGTANSRNRSSDSDFSHLAIRRIREKEEKEPGLKAEYYKLSEAPSQIPNLDALVPEVTRTETAINYVHTPLAWPGTGFQFVDQFASRHSGFLYIELHGSYTFYLQSDDGSRMFLDGRKIIDNDGLHSMRTRQATTVLTPGYHSVKIEHFENNGWVGLVLTWKGPNFDERVVSPNLLYHKEKLKAHWRLDETSGNKAEDSTGHGYAGLVKNDDSSALEKFDAEWLADGAIGRALSLRGNAFVDIPNIDVSEKAYGLSLWFRTTSPFAGGLFAVAVEDDNGWWTHDRELHLQDGNIHASILVSPGTHEGIITTDLRLDDNQWHHVVHTFGGAEGGQKIYVDGKLSAKGSAERSSFDWQRRVTIGRGDQYQLMGFPFQGELDDIRLYDGALSQGEVTVLYEEGNADDVALLKKASFRNEHVQRPHDGGLRKHGHHFNLGS